MVGLGYLLLFIFSGLMFVCLLLLFVDVGCCWRVLLLFVVVGCRVVVVACCLLLSVVSCLLLVVHRWSLLVVRCCFLRFVVYML